MARPRRVCSAQRRRRRRDRRTRRLQLHEHVQRGLHPSRRMAAEPVRSTRASRAIESNGIDYFKSPLLADRPVDIEVSFHRIKQLGAATLVIDIKIIEIAIAHGEHVVHSMNVTEKIALNLSAIHLWFEVRTDG